MVGIVKLQCNAALLKSLNILIASAFVYPESASIRQNENLKYFSNAKIYYMDSDTGKIPAE